ncbi:MAG TPA: 6-carboxytetrahydropterin synthase, partial [Candidatus Xenobia bacterium]
MTSPIVVRRLDFCAGHRVYRHESKCAWLHGHNYVLYVHATAPGLDALGRIVDFSVLKARFGAWIADHWDHAMILWKDDHEAIEALGHVPGQRLYLLDTNPTAENMAITLLESIGPHLMADTGVQISRICLWETPNCYVEVSADA